MNDSDDIRMNPAPQPPKPSRNDPLPFDDSDDKIHAPSGSASKYKPLHLGASSTETPSEKREIKLPTSRSKISVEQVSSSDDPNHITGIKTFYTKLHAGGIDYIDEVINKWLKANPDVRIKRTNTVTGEVQGKKTEPNIIVTVWY